MEINEADILNISELFVSIQGESTHSGLPCGFVRLAGCNLNCVWCDTAYACADGQEMTIGKIMNTVSQWHVPLIEITGGEPLLQSGCVALAESLLKKGHTVLIETNGSLPIDALPEAVIRIMDIKCPGSGMSEKMHWPNVDALNSCDEVKFVLASREDYEWALNTMKQYYLAERCGAILLSAVSGSLDAAELADWMMEDRPPARMQLQLHKILWPPDRHGV